MDDRLRELLAAIEAGEDDRAETAALAVGRWGNAALPVLRDWLASEKRDRRWWAVRAMAALGSAEAIAELVTTLADGDPDVRACAVVGLAGLRPAQAVEPLVRCLGDPSAYVARLAADGLAQFGSAATKALIAALQSENVTARVGAARALSVIQPEEAVPALCAALDDPSAAVMHYAEEALEKMGVGLVLFRP